MDPLTTAGLAISAAKITIESIKATNAFIDRWHGAPDTIATSKVFLDCTQGAVESLRSTIEIGSRNAQTANTIDDAVRTSNILAIFQRTQSVCDGFNKTVARLSQNSRRGKFSKLDKFATAMSDSQLQRFQQQLSDCQTSMRLALGVFDR